MDDESCKCGILEHGGSRISTQSLFHYDVFNVPCGSNKLIITSTVENSDFSLLNRDICNRQNISDSNCFRFAEEYVMSLTIVTKNAILVLSLPRTCRLVIVASARESDSIFDDA
jgi:uncharacterized radical SAM superfamily Fe-S cluster-containing enzyme